MKSITQEPQVQFRSLATACCLWESLQKRRKFSPNGDLAQAEMKWKSDKTAALQGVKQCCRD